MAKAKPHRQTWQGIPDPMEAQVEHWLMTRGIAFTRDHPSRLDFWLPGLNLFIECKRFSTPRLIEQLARVDGGDVLVLQGIGALGKLERLMGRGGDVCHQVPRERCWISAYLTHQEMGS